MINWGFQSLEVAFGAPFHKASYAPGPSVWRASRGLGFRVYGLGFRV